MQVCYHQPICYKKPYTSLGFGPLASIAAPLLAQLATTVLWYAMTLNHDVPGVMHIIQTAAPIAPNIPQYCNTSAPSLKGRNIQHIDSLEPNGACRYYIMKALTVACILVWLQKTMQPEQKEHFAGFGSIAF